MASQIQLSDLDTGEPVNFVKSNSSKHLLKITLSKLTIFFDNINIGDKINILGLNVKLKTALKTSYHNA